MRANNKNIIVNIDSIGGDYVTGGVFNTSTGEVTLSRLSGGTVTYNLDGRYLTGFTIPSTYIESGDNISELVNDVGYITGFTDTNTFVTGSTFNTSTGDLTLSRLSGGTVVENLDGRYALTGDLIPNTDDYVTSGTVTGGNLQLTRLSGGTVDIDVSSLLDDTNTDDFTTGATFNTGTGEIIFTRQSGDTYNVDLDGRYALTGDLIPNTDDYVSSGSFNTGTGEVTLTRLSGGTVVYDLDGRYLLESDFDTYTGSTVDNNDDDYVTGMTFNTGTGVLTLTRLSGGTVTEDLDGRYLEEHPNIIAASSSDNSGRTYIQDILLDPNGHVTGLTTSTETVVNTNTTYTTSAVDSGANAIIRLTGSDASTDDITLVAGSNMTITPVGDNITLAATNTTYSATLTAGTGLSGTTYNPSTSTTFSLDFSELSVGGTLVGTDYLIAENGGVENRQLISNIPLSIFNNDAGFITSVADFLRADVADVKTSGNLRFNDNIKSTFGNSDDMQIYHVALSNYIDLSVGDLFIRNVSTPQFTFGRTTGDFTATGDLRMSSNDTYLYADTSSNVATRIHGINASNIEYIGSVDQTTSSTRIANNTGDVIFGDTRMRILSNGRVGIGASVTPVAQLESVNDSSAAYATTNLAEFVEADDAFALRNSNVSIANGYTSIFMQSQGSSGDASGRINLINQSAGQGSFTWQLRDNSHTTDMREKMRLTSDGNVFLTGGINTEATNTFNNSTVITDDNRIDFGTGNDVRTQFVSGSNLFQTILYNNADWRVSVNGGQANAIYVDGSSTGSGFVGIGKSSPGVRLDVDENFDSISTAEERGGRFTTDFNVSGSGLKQGLRLDTNARHTSGTQASLNSLLTLINGSGVGGTTTDATGIWSRIDASTGHTITNSRNFWARNGASAGTHTNQYGLYVDNLTSGSNNWAVYTDGTTDSYFGGQVGIADTPYSSYSLTISAPSGQIEKMALIDSSFTGTNNLSFRTGGGITEDMRLTSKVVGQNELYTIRNFRIMTGSGTGTQTMFIDATSKRVGIGNNSLLDSLLHVYENTATTGNTRGITVENVNGDAQINLISGTLEWVIGLDTDDGKNLTFNSGEAPNSGGDNITFGGTGSIFTSGTITAGNAGDRQLIRGVDALQKTVVTDSSTTNQTLGINADFQYRRFTGSSNINLQIDTNDMDIGETAYIEQAGTGTVTITAGAGVTLRKNSNLTFVTDGQYSTVAIMKVGAAEFKVFGELAPI